MIKALTVCGSPTVHRGFWSLRGNISPDFTGPNLIMFARCGIVTKSNYWEKIEDESQAVS